MRPGTHEPPGFWHHGGVHRLDPIRLRYRLGPSDVVRAFQLHTACPGLIAVMSWAVTAAAAALVVHREGGSAWLVQGLIGIAALLGFVVVMAPACAAWHWHRARGFFAPHELCADDRGVEVAGGRRSARLPWTAIARWRESPQQFLLYASRTDFVVVPKHAFDSVGELDAFKATLEAHLGPSGLAAAGRG